jgi:type IV pilus assembly protein PilY1
MTIRTVTGFLLATALASVAPWALAEDIDIFSQNTSIQTGAPNVLIVLDDTANWSQSFGTNDKFTAEKAALASVVSALTGQFNLGLMFFTETGNPNNNVDGGYVRFAIQSMSDTSGAATSARNCLLKMVDPSGGSTYTTSCLSTNTNYSNLLIGTNPGDKSNGGKIGTTMAEAYYYFNGSNAYAGSNKVKADPLAFGAAPNGGPTDGSAPYLSPSSTGTCAKNFIIVISNGPFQDNSSDTSTAMSQLSTAGGDTTIINPPDTSSNNNAGDEWTRFLNKSSVNAITYTLEVGPSTNGQGPYNTQLLQSMGTQGGGGYFSAISAADLLAKLTRIFNDIQARNSVFASSSLPLSADNTGNFSNQVYMGVFRPDGGGQPRWVGNLKEYQFGVDSNGTLSLVDALGAAAASSQSGFAASGAQSFWTSKVTTAPDAAASPATSTANGSTGGFWFFDSKGDGGSYDLPDGEWVEKGGAAEQLRLAYLGYGGRGGIGDLNTSTINAKPSRQIYTCTGTCLTTTGGVLLSNYPFDSSNSDVTADPTTFNINPVPVTVSSVSSDRPVSTIASGTALTGVVSSLKVVGTVATVTMSKNHNLPSGTSSVTIAGSSIAGTNGTYIVTNTGNKTFTYVVTAVAGTSTGTPTATTASTTATVQTSVAHGFSTGTAVTISGASCPTGPLSVDSCTAYNGSSFTVGSVVNSTTFTITLASPGVGATANTGTILASATIARVTTAAAHGYSTGDSVTIANASCTPNCSVYNTTATITRIPTSTTFDYVYTASAPVPAATNSGITATNNTPSGSTLTSMLKWIRGQDTQNENGFQVAGANTDVRPSIHGDVLHARPLVLNYAATGATTDNIYIFYGGNDGVLRAVKGGQASTDGMEQWAFIAQEFFPILKRQFDNSPPVLYPSTPSGLGATHRNYAWDGPITSYVKRDSTGAVSQALLFVSVRRGGRFIYALDVTTPTAPKFLWRRGCVTSGSTTTCDTGYSEIGQTWSTPIIASIQATQANGHPVLIFGGGYDPTSEDSEPPATADAMGRAVYFVDATTGDVIWSVGNSNTTITDSRLTFAFTADVLAVDRHQIGFIDRVYAADIGGNLWRIDTPGTTTAGWSIHNIASVGGRTSSSAGRKFMFGPDMVVTQAGTFDAVVIGSGDREHPLSTSADATATTNRAYMFVDPNVNTTGTDLNITEAQLAAVDTTGTTAVDLSGKQGWYVALRTGEKVVNGPIVVASDMIFGTNQPCASGKVNASGDCDASGTTLTCTGNLGIARRYDINFLTASPSGFKDSSGNLIRSVTAAGGGFLPSPVAGVVTIGGVPYTFVTDNPLDTHGVITPTINVPKTRFRTYWHEVLE